MVLPSTVNDVKAANTSVIMDEEGDDKNKHNKQCLKNLPQVLLP
jgi:hypothetical protein